MAHYLNWPAEIRVHKSVHEASSKPNTAFLYADARVYTTAIDLQGAMAVNFLVNQFGCTFLSVRGKI